MDVEEQEQINAIDESSNTDSMSHYAAKRWPEHYRKAGNVVGVTTAEILSQLYDVDSMHTKKWFQVHSSSLNTNGCQYDFNMPALNSVSLTGLDNIAKALFIEEGVSLESRDVDDATPLMSAAHEGHISTARLLLLLGADINAQGYYYGIALHAAASSGHGSVVEMLLAEGANVNAQAGQYDTALQAAAIYGNLDIVGVLIEKGADVNLQGGFYGAALQAAALTGGIEIVKLFIEAGADINIKGGSYGTALQAAASHGCIETVKLLIETGADVNIEGEAYAHSLPLVAPERSLLRSDRQRASSELIELAFSAASSSSRGAIARTVSNSPGRSGSRPGPEKRKAGEDESSTDDDVPLKASKRARTSNAATITRRKRKQYDSDENLIEDTYMHEMHKTAVEEMDKPSVSKKVRLLSADFEASGATNGKNEDKTMRTWKPATVFRAAGPDVVDRSPSVEPLSPVPSPQDEVVAEETQFKGEEEIIPAAISSDPSVMVTETRVVAPKPTRIVVVQAFINDDNKACFLERPSRVKKLSLSYDIDNKGKVFLVKETIWSKDELKLTPERRIEQLKRQSMSPISEYEDVIQLWGYPEPDPYSDSVFRTQPFPSERGSALHDGQHKSVGMISNDSAAKAAASESANKDETKRGKDIKGKSSSCCSSDSSKPFVEPPVKKSKLDNLPTQFRIDEATKDEREDFEFQESFLRWKQGIPPVEGPRKALKEEEDKAFAEEQARRKIVRQTLNAGDHWKVSESNTEYDTNVSHEMAGRVPEPLTHPNTTPIEQNPEDDDDDKLWLALQGVALRTDRDDRPGWTVQAKKDKDEETKRQRELRAIDRAKWAAWEAEQNRLNKEWKAGAAARKKEREAKEAERGAKKAQRAKEKAERLETEASKEDE
ncbi:hypothetical protein B9Z65_3981 [Elsinoe australis]|uniref:Uncharacterized protein n=1 Tax=Elsinoe australis TaxID=40998 RepID=A0A2P7Z1H7_9PEZI|nr:hypothetical protein B9Z65_3981 [Elsinoe australis]